MQNKFSELGLMPEILKAIEEMGFVEPTEVQSQAIPTILDHKDVIVMSKTGSGKTAVFGIPMLQIINPDEEGPQGLILTPTRELAVQIDSDLKLMSKYLSHKTTVVYGQHSMNVEVQSLKKGTAIVTGTPGRVFDHLRQGNLVTKHIRFLVLDEADRMLDMGFYGQVIRIVKALPRNRITLLFSATIPAEVQRISRDFMSNPIMIEIESQTMTVDTVRQVYYRLNRNEKQTQLNRLLLTEQPESCMIFCNTRFAVDQVQSFLSRKGYAAQSLHGDIPQAKRMKTIEQFKEGTFHILVATDVAARGIHIDNLSLVINYDVPLENDGYVHRIGRTGRAGNEGLAITLVTGDDIMSLYEIEEHTGAMITEAELPTDAILEERKESADQWILANANQQPLEPSSSSATRSGSKRGNPRSKTAAPRFSSRSNAASSPRASSDPTSRSSSSVPPPRPLSSTKDNSNLTSSVKPIREKGNPDMGSEKFHPAAPHMDRKATEKNSELKTMRKPHVRIIGQSSEEIAVSTPVKRTEPGIEANRQKAAAPHTDNEIAIAKEPVVKKIWNRLFLK